MHIPVHTHIHVHTHTLQAVKHTRTYNCTSNLHPYPHYYLQTIVTKPNSVRTEVYPQAYMHTCIRIHAYTHILIYSYTHILLY